MEGSVVRFIDGKWKQLKDHTGSVIYNKEDSAQSKVVIEVGDIEDAWTLEEPLLNSIWKDGSWVIQLDLLRESKRVEINAWRNAEESKTDQVVVVGDVTWNADPFSRARIESTIQSSYIPPIWTDANDIDQSITREALIAIHTAIVQQGFTIHARQREMKAELLALETIDELNNYIVGWEQIEES